MFIVNVSPAQSNFSKNKTNPPRTESNVGMPIYKTHMRLHIYNIQQTDYGTYKCVAKNPRGETDGTIRLYSKYNALRNILSSYSQSVHVRSLVNAPLSRFRWYLSNPQKS